MIPRQRNALLAQLTPSGLRHVSRGRGAERPTPTVEEEAREMMARFLASLPCAPASLLMHRFLRSDQSTVEPNRLGFQDE